MLTQKELQVLQLRKKGLNQKQIAQKLKISQPAVSGFENNANKKIKDAKDIIKTVRRLNIKIG